jgi:hypothetical protein
MSVMLVKDWVTKSVTPECLSRMCQDYRGLSLCVDRLAVHCNFSGLAQCSFQTVPLSLSPPNTRETSTTSGDSGC